MEPAALFIAVFLFLVSFYVDIAGFFTNDVTSYCSALYLVQQSNNSNYYYNCDTIFQRPRSACCVLRVVLTTLNSVALAPIYKDFLNKSSCELDFAAWIRTLDPQETRPTAWPPTEVPKRQYYVPLIHSPSRWWAWIFVEKGPKLLETKK